MNRKQLKKKWQEMDLFYSEKEKQDDKATKLSRKIEKQPEINRLHLWQELQSKEEEYWQTHKPEPQNIARLYNSFEYNITERIYNTPLPFYKTPIQRSEIPTLIEVQRLRDRENCSLYEVKKRIQNLRNAVIDWQHIEYFYDYLIVNKFLGLEEIENYNLFH